MGNDLPISFACAVLGLVTLIFVFFFDEDPADSSPLRSRLDQLFERRDTIYENLRDLRFEFRTGKFSEQDFEQMKAALQAEAARVLAGIEEITGGPAGKAQRIPSAKSSPA
jgi:hypothetical protein